MRLDISQTEGRLGAFALGAFGSVHVCFPRLLLRTARLAYGLMLDVEFTPRENAPDGSVWLESSRSCSRRSAGAWPIEETPAASSRPTGDEYLSIRSASSSFDRPLEQRLTALAQLFTVRCQFVVDARGDLVVPRPLQ